MSKAIHQLVHTLSYGDAISGEVIALKRCFQKMGYESEIYSINTHPKLEGQAENYKDLDANFNGEVVLHYSLGSPLNALFKSLEKAKRSIIYHNLTPSKWFEKVNPRITKDIEQGAKELPELCKIADHIISDSKFNASELKKLGFDSEVLELTIDPEKWNIESNPGIKSLVKNDPDLHLLHVGRMAPNKCIEDIIKTFYFLHHKINRNSKLWLVGIDTDTELYSFSLKRLVDELDLKDSVKFAGCLADSEVKALYEESTAYLCMSEHEGFCVPVIEAMHFGLPVLSFASSALPDTILDGGILFSEKKYPELALLIQKIYEDSEFKNQLVKAGKNRLKSLSFENFEARVEKVFN